ncbi:fibrous sheath CABYR-binding protein-like [Aphis craccivora]|uniref:Fibrous sheath CABYR-binding protein-like n=1 Tax=Aphis craccivora TaxID=307492 RepID=A0A6G0ZE74_APHCR|nr:fibrous sheath CABYR-binding protein-like [Aphis craccivora]
MPVETDPDVPAECPTSDSEAPVDEDLELMCAEEKQISTSTLSAEPITPEILAVETDVGPPTSKTSRRNVQVTPLLWRQQRQLQTSLHTTMTIER